MNSIDALHARLTFRLGRMRITPNIGWLLAIPAGLWLIQAYYLPILGGELAPIHLWIAGGSILLSIMVSLAVHAMGHILVARAMKSGAPEAIHLSPVGDLAQAWPDSTSPREDAFVALGGPVFSLALAGLVYLVWNAQLNAVLNAVTLFALVFNLWLFAVNLTPAYPFDGGRFLKAVIWEVGVWPARAARVARRIGWIVAAGMTCWAVFLILQHARFSWATGGVTIGFVMLIVTGLLVRSPQRDITEPPAGAIDQAFHPGDALVAGLTILCQIIVAFSLVLTNDGLEAPGAALSVEPMVKVPSAYMHAPVGTFILTSVLVQTPITAGEWVIGKLSPVVNIVPPETIVPEDTTPQEQARQGIEMLDESETTAIVVGMRLAGLSADLVGKGVEVVDIQPDSHASGILQPGDVIIRVNGESVRVPSELVDRIKAQDGKTKVQLTIEHLGQQHVVDVPLIPPAQPGDSPRIGIVIQPAGFDVNLPFPVEIHSQKIVGGPSAGLMFTLTVYNLLTPEDLTRGWKIAGTGTIALDGAVGPIGGVEQKVAAAEAAGASYFLCPADNYDDAVAVARDIQVVKIETVDQALAFLRGLPAD
jgi:PDZ domain-containing protein